MSSGTNWYCKYCQHDKNWWTSSKWGELHSTPLTFTTTPTAQLLRLSLLRSTSWSIWDSKLICIKQFIPFKSQKLHVHRSFMPGLRMECCAYTYIWYCNWYRYFLFVLSLFICVLLLLSLHILWLQHRFFFDLIILLSWIYSCKRSKGRGLIEKENQENAGFSTVKGNFISSIIYSIISHLQYKIDFRKIIA